MSTKYPCYIEFSDSGKTARLVHKNGTVLAEMLIHGSFADRTNQAHTHRCVCGHSSAAHSIARSQAIKNTACEECGQCKQYVEARHHAFQAEVYGLPDYEQLDMQSEILIERTA